MTKRRYPEKAPRVHVSCDLCSTAVVNRLRSKIAKGDEGGASFPSAGRVAPSAREEPQQQVLLAAAEAAGSESESAASSAISGLVAGAAVSTSKQLLLYPVDTVKVCAWILICLSGAEDS